jgi:hypothetical protein
MYISPKSALLVSITLLPLYNIGFEHTLEHRMRYPLYYIPIFFMFGTWTINRLTRLKKEAYSLSGLHTLGIFFVGWSGIALLWTINISGGITSFLELISGFLIFLLLPDIIKTKKDIRQIFGFLIGVGFLLGVTTFVSHWHYGEKIIELGENLEFYISLISEKGRAAGFAGVNYAATVLNFFIFVGLSLLFLSPEKKMGIMIIIFFLVVAVIMTGSKSGFGGLIIGLVFLSLSLPFFKGRRVKYLFVTMAGIFSAYVIGSIIAAGTLKARVVAVGVAFSYETRFEWWAKGFRELLKTYGIGLGTGGLKEILDPVLFAHNIFLSTLFDLGVIGLCMLTLLLVCLFVAFRNAVKICADKQLEAVLFCMIAAMTGFLINNLVQGDYYNRLFWFMLGLDLAIIRLVYDITRSADNHSPRVEF